MKLDMKQIYPLPNPNPEYPITTDEILRRAYTQYPYFHRGIEIECGDGQRIATGRKRGLRLYGYSTRNYKTAWYILGVDPFIRQGETLDELPYKDNTFDLVMIPKAMEYVNLNELYRIGSRLFYIKLRPESKIRVKDILDVGFKLEVYQISNIGNMIVECRK